MMLLFDLQIKPTSFRRLGDDWINPKRKEVRKVNDRLFAVAVVRLSIAITLAYFLH